MLSAVPNAPPAAPPRAQASPETLALVRESVRDILESAPAFRALSADRRRAIAQQTVEIASYLAEPDGIRGNRLARAQAGSDGGGLSQRGGAGEEGKFVAQGAREGAAVAGALLQAVNFPTFVASLIQGVFHAIVTSSIEQMEAYGKLVADVAKTLNQFRDENVTANQGRDHIVEQFPDLFRIDVDTGEDGVQGPRVRVRDGVDERQALQRVNSTLPVEGAPLSSLDDESVEQKLVPAARTQLATSRQQLLATMVLMGINRIVVTDGKIQAKVMYDFQAKDNFKFQKSATSFDYGDQYATTSEGEYESESQGGERSRSYSKDSGSESEERDGSYYAKGKYKSTAAPVLKLASAYQQTSDAALQTRASLAGVVDINFKSDYLPLEKMADSFQIGQIQTAARPGAARPAGGAPASPTPATQPAAPAPATPAPR